MAMEHYLTYQHNVQKYFLGHTEKYSGVIVPMSIAVSFASGTYGFVRALCAREEDKRYAIDPRTPLFQKRWNREKHKRPPHERMAKAFGGAFASKGLKGPLDPGDFDEGLEEVVRRCLDFQLQFRTRDEDARKLAKYKELLGIEEMGDLRKPLFVIPPYFQFDKQGDGWFSVSMRATDFAAAMSTEAPVRPVVHFKSWGALTDVGAIIGALEKDKIESFWLYPNNFKEHEADLDDLKAYRDAVSKANDAGREASALHGGYFAIILSLFGLRGFANGVGYGEWRDSGYHKGGMASTRVYIPKLHRYLDAPEAQSLLDRSDYFGGDADLIASCIEAKRPLSGLSQQESLDHFLECRRSEMELVGGQGIEGVRSELQETIERIEEDLGPLELDRYGKSLKRWLEAIE